VSIQRLIRSAPARAVFQERSRRTFGWHLSAQRSTLGAAPSSVGSPVPFTRKPFGCSFGPLHREVQRIVLEARPGGVAGLRWKSTEQGGVCSVPGHQE